MQCSAFTDTFIEHSDRLTADDELGRVEVDLSGEYLLHCRGAAYSYTYALPELYENKGKMTRRTSSLSHINQAKEKNIPGSIDYSVGFFEKVPPRQANKAKEIELADLPEDLRNHPQMKPEKAKSLNEDEELITSTPPDPDYPSGILSIREFAHHSVS